MSESAVSVSSPCILPEIDIKTEERKEICKPTVWFLESIGPNGEYGDVYLFVVENGSGQKCIGIVLHMESNVTSVGVPCIFAHIESPVEQKLFSLELEYGQYSPELMAASMAGMEMSMARMGWVVPNYTKSIHDSGLTCCEDVVEGFRKVRSMQLEQDLVTSSKVYCNAIRAALKGTTLKQVGAEVFTKKNLSCSPNEISVYVAVKKSRRVLSKEVSKKAARTPELQGKEKAVERKVGPSAPKEGASRKKQKPGKAAPVQVGQQSAPIPKKKKPVKKDKQQQMVVREDDPGKAQESGQSGALMIMPLNLQKPDDVFSCASAALERPEGQQFWAKFAHMYPFGQTRVFQIPVLQCDCAPPQYVYRTVNRMHYQYLIEQFTMSPHVVDMIADLVPYDQNTKQMLKMEDIKLEAVNSYRYFVISGQHSIMVAKAIVSNAQCPEHLKDCYTYRNARILGAQDSLETLKLSRLMNQLHQQVMVKTPYQDSLLQARKQWEFFGCPPKPVGGRSAVNSKWKEFFDTIKVTLELINATKDLHMILCDERIFHRWVDIMEKYVIGEIANNKGEHSNKQAIDLAKARKMQVEGTTQLSATMFRCLQGLADEEILKIQDLIFKGSLLLKKAKNVPMRDMEDIALSYKYDNALKTGIVDYFRSIAGDHTDSYEAMAENYKITKDIYDKLYKWSKDWMKESVNKAKRKQDLPEVVRTELRLAHAKAFGLKQHMKFERPWRVFNTGKVMSSFTNVIAACGTSNDIGLVMLDTTGQGHDDAWDVDAFKRLVECIAGLISGDSYVLLAIVPFGSVQYALDITLRHIVGSVHLEYGSYTKENADTKKYTGSLDFAVVMAMVSKEEGKTLWNDIIPNKELVTIIFDEADLHVDKSEDDPSFTGKETFVEKNITYESCGLQGGPINKNPKKNSFFSVLIKSLCHEGKVVVDAYTGGYAMRTALQSQRKTIVFVNDIAEKELLEAYASKMVECLPEVNSFYKSFGEEDNTLPNVASSSHAHAVPEGFISDVMNQSSLELFNEEEDAQGLPPNHEDDDMVPQDTQEGLAVGETSVVQQAS